jgi:arylsulfatase
MIGSRSIVHNGWKATTDHVGAQISIERELVPGSHDFATDRWSLFRLEDDFAEAHDLAADRPEVVAELEQLWWHEAGRNGVLPLDDSLVGRAIAIEPGPNLPRPRRVFRPGGGPIAEDFLPGLGAGFRVRADVEVAERPGGGAPEGIVCALGDWSGGWAWYLLDGRPAATFCLLGTPHRLVAPDAVAAGAHTLGLSYVRVAAGGGPLALDVDGVVVAETTLPTDLPLRWQIGGAGLRIGHDAGFPVDDAYAAPFPFTGTLRELAFESPGGGARRRPPRLDEEVTRALRHE